MWLRDDTVDQSGSRVRGDSSGGTPDPALIKVFSADAPRLETLPADAALVIGRGADCGCALDDPRASRRHAEVVFDGARWIVRDLGSHNGTFLDGDRVGDRATSAAADAVLCIGNTVFLLVAHARALAGVTVEVRDGVVVGPRMRTVWEQVRQLALKSKILHLTGETGTGKEILARHFHASSQRAKGPFVAVNCAAVPPALAERLLFGARRGAYSGADADSDGYLDAAAGGTLFLDEVGELPTDVQAKLLRALESGEVMPLGAARVHKVDLAVCSATHADLRRRVRAGAFREDLYFRLSQPSIEVMPLRARREEIPWIIDATLKRVSTARAHAGFVEAALLRPWPGNVRELVNAVTAAANLASNTEGSAPQVRHLSSHVGLAMVMTPQPNTRSPSARVPSPSPVPSPRPPDDAPPPLDAVEAKAIRDVLTRERGNVTKAARALGLHRTQLRRLLARHQIDARQFKRHLPGQPDDSDDSDTGP